MQNIGDDDNDKTKEWKPKKKYSHKLIFFS